MSREEVMGEQEYVLGTDDEELTRLGLQHELWREVALQGWKRGGFKAGHALLDVGCGPGYAAFDLARLVGDGGQVVGVDVSHRFVNHLNAQREARGLKNVTAQMMNVEELDLPASVFDGAFARWVLCFVSSPAAVVDGVARSLKRDGTFVVQDYCHYEGVTIGPPNGIFARVFGAVAETWRARGGDPNVGSVVPSLMERCDLEVKEINAISRVARPGTPLWQWPETFFKNYLPTLVELGSITEAEKKVFENAWQ
ncbi:MAG: methyltransferase domain-containing protein, partial [Pyrinomonadaceae bacterium]|nr:methyltransferase domain-containing protein [Pyrinomonadaceae bacterium]